MLSFRSRGRHGDRPSGGLSSSVLLRVGGWGGLRWWCSAPACAQRPWILSSLTAWPGDACAVDPTQPPRAPGPPPVPAARFLLLACTPGPWLRLACFPWRPASRPPLPPRAMCLDIRSWWPGPSLQPGSWLPAHWASRSLGGTDRQASLLSRRLQLLPTNPALGRGCPSESVRPWALSLGPTAPHGALLYVMINLLSKSNNSLS